LRQFTQTTDLFSTGNRYFKQSSELADTNIRSISIGCVRVWRSLCCFHCHKIECLIASFNNIN